MARHRSDARSQMEAAAPENEEEEDNDFEDEGELRDPAEPTSLLREWLKSVTQWEGALDTLGTRKGGLVGSDKLTIRVVNTLAPAAPQTQATITQTLEAISEGDPDWVRGNRVVLADAAKKNMPSNGGKDAYKALVDVEGADNKWTESFPGHVHCEASLVSRLKSDRVPVRASSQLLIPCAELTCFPVSRLAFPQHRGLQALLLCVRRVPQGSRREDCLYRFSWESLCVDLPSEHAFGSSADSPTSPASPSLALPGDQNA